MALASPAPAQETTPGPVQQAQAMGERLQELDAAQLRAALAQATAGDALPEGVPFVARFAGQVDGLRVGAPVLAHGIRVGTVRDISVDFVAGPAAVEASVAVDLDLVPERIVVDGARLTSPEALRAAIGGLVARGLRARLVAGEFPLGRAAIELVVDPAAAPPPVAGGQDELPTLPPEPDRLRGELERLLARLAALPLERIAADVGTSAVALRELLSGPELRAAIAGVAEAADVLPGLAARLEPEAVALLAGLTNAAAAARHAAERTAGTVASLDGTIGARAPLWTDLHALLLEADGAMRGLRLLLDYLERHPDALIRGRTGAAP